MASDDDARQGRWRDHRLDTPGSAVRSRGLARSARQLVVATCLINRRAESDSPALHKESYHAKAKETVTVMQQLRTLVLMPWVREINRVTDWRNGVVLAVTGKADVLEEYDVECASPSLLIQVPAVLRLRRSDMQRSKKSVKFSRQNVYARDKYRCCYCGQRKARHELNYDHVIPRVRGGKTVWENIVTSCYSCNDRKGSRTPAEAGLTMHYRPYRPTSLPITLPVAIDPATAPALWLPYLDIMQQTQSA